jgi:phosphoribosylanthranilate isomerase
MWIKICANTNVEDVQAAVALGADAVGFVFAPSKRQVHAAQVARITQQMASGVERVGVFAGASAEAIADAVSEAGLDAVQLHGGVDLEIATNLRARLRPGISLIHSIPWMVGESDASERVVREQLQKVREFAPEERVLIDAQVGAQSGGLGVSFDWDRAKMVLADFPTLRVIVAGGLRPDNVAAAVRTLLPFGVDVASGVEATPGRKDFSKLKSFIENARTALCESSPAVTGIS